MNDSNSISEEKITLQWLHENVPLTWWFWLFGICTIIFGAGMTFAQWKSVSGWFDRSFSVSYEQPLKKAKNKITELKYQLSVAKERESICHETNQKNILKWKKKNELLDISNELLSQNSSKIEEQKKYLQKENQLLKNEIDSLKKKLKNNHDVKVSNQVSYVKNHSYNTKNKIQGIINSLSGMSSSQVGQFIIDIIPTIKGGVTCKDLAVMLGNGYSSHGAAVVKKVAPYVQRPFSADCFTNLSSKMYSSEAAGAIESLIKSTPAY